MKRKRLWIIRLAVALLIISCIAVLDLLSDAQGDETGQGMPPIPLHPPSFINVASAQEGRRAGTDFLEEEAGISAYTHAGRPIDLSIIQPLFRTIERETEEYIIGSIPVPDYDETWDVHVYAHRDGWILAYYLSHEPAVKMMDWRHYDGSSAMNTQLETVLGLILNQIGVVPDDIKYYDFRYPEATHIMLIADYEADGDSWDSFQLRIPAGFTVYERAWLHAGYDNDLGSLCQLNDIDINSFAKNCNDCWQVKYGELELQQLVPEKYHKISVYNNEYCCAPKLSGYSLCTISLVYQEPS